MGKPIFFIRRRILKKFFLRIVFILEFLEWCWVERHRGTDEIRVKHLIFESYIMLNFFYDSLETLKKVKKPKSSDVWNLTLIIFIVVIIAALLFALMDGVFGEVYNFIYESLSGAFDGIGRANVAAPAIDL